MALTINMHRNDCNFYLFYSLVYMWGRINVRFVNVRMNILIQPQT